MRAQFKKEWRELVRSWKLFILPIVFALLAVGQPVAYKLMPILLKSATNLPAGTVIEIPIPSAGEVMAAVLSQLNMLGVVIIALMAMGAIAGERNSGVAATVLSKPVSRSAYVLSKVLAYALLVTISLSVAVALAAYYTNILIAPVDWLTVWQGFLIYLPFLVFVLALTILFGTFLPSPLASAGSAIATMIVLGTVGPYLPIKRWLPSALPGEAARVLTGALWSDYLTPLLVTLLLVLGVLLLSITLFERQEI